MANGIKGECCWEKSTFVTSQKPESTRTCWLLLVILTSFLSGRTSLPLNVRREKSLSHGPQPDPFIALDDPGLTSWDILTHPNRHGAHSLSFIARNSLAPEPFLDPFLILAFQVQLVPGIQRYNWYQQRISEDDSLNDGWCSTPAPCSVVRL